jgi:hypothetical protein
LQGLIFKHIFALKQNQAMIKEQLENAAIRAIDALTPQIIEQNPAHYYRFSFALGGRMYIGYIYRNGTVTLKASLYGEMLHNFMYPFPETRCKDEMQWHGAIEIESTI